MVGARSVVWRESKPEDIRKRESEKFRERKRCEVKSYDTRDQVIHKSDSTR